jgi:hypothetical protein
MDYTWKMVAVGVANAFVACYGNKEQAIADIYNYDMEAEINNVAAIEWLLRALNGTPFAALDIAEEIEKLQFNGEFQ